MTTPSDPDHPSAPSPPLDPVVMELARRIKASSLPEARALVPLSGEQRRALTDRLLGADEDASPEERSVEDSSPRTAPNPPALRLVPSPETKKPRAWRWWPIAVAAAIAILSTTAVWFGAAPSPRDLVAYDLRVEGDLAVRGDDPPPAEAPMRLRPSTRLLVVLSPRGPARDASLRMLVVRGGRARLLRPAYENDGRGQLTIDRPTRDVIGNQQDGPAELVWLVGPQMPADVLLEPIALTQGLAPPPGCAVLRRAVVFEGWSAAMEPVEELPMPANTAPAPMTRVVPSQERSAIPRSPAPPPRSPRSVGLGLDIK